MPPLIDEPTNRVYRGLDPSLPPFYRSPETTFIQDRIEAVHFEWGTYLVICGVHPHFFNDGMFGFVSSAWGMMPQVVSLDLRGLTLLGQPMP